jgi:hypothetical protein
MRSQTATVRDLICYLCRCEDLSRLPRPEESPGVLPGHRSCLHGLSCSRVQWRASLQRLLESQEVRRIQRQLKEVPGPRKQVQSLPIRGKQGAKRGPRPQGSGPGQETANSVLNQRRRVPSHAGPSGRKVCHLRRWWQVSNRSLPRFRGSSRTPVSFLQLHARILQGQCG